MLALEWPGRRSLDLKGTNLVGPAILGLAASLMNGLIGLLLQAWLGPIVRPAMLAPQGPWAWGWLILQAALLAPVVESIAFIWLVGQATRAFGPSRGLWITATGFALAHSFQTPRWGIQALPLFFLTAALLIAWRERNLPSRLAGTIVLHAVHNLVALGTLV